MRIVIDMQGAQSSSSRFRGIGRYTMSLAQAIVHNCGNHEIILALNGLYPDTIEPIRFAFNNMLPQENIRVWYAVDPVAFMDSTNDWRRKSAEIVREAFLASLRPDVVHVSSLFEGLGDNIVSSVGLLSQNILVSVTLYDLIPLIYSNTYLKNPVHETWYRSKLEHLQRADLLLAISESSKREGIDYLGFPEERSINISTDADKHFRLRQVSAEAEDALRHTYGLTRPFVMYTGGVDHRKNIDALIRAFSILPIELRKEHQLVIVCSVQPENRLILESQARLQGLSDDEVIVTGYVSEDDLVAFYNLCKLFVFPSWHEGFGLPALEAMRCGAPVIGANTSSLPEVIGWEKALFNPHSDEDIAQAIRRALSDERFRLELINRGKLQSEKFSWDESARKAISSMERLHVERQARSANQKNTYRPKLAFISPLPPERSGISYYSAELLPELVRYYEIDVIVVQDEISDSWITSHCPVRSVQWFIENASRYDRVLYHFGNSAFHQHMFDLLKVVPGVVVLHDFFLSGIIHYLDEKAIVPDFLNESLYESHGYPAVRERGLHKDAELVLSKYPCNLGVLQESLGIISHSVTSYKLAEKWYGHIDQKDWKVIPLLRTPPQAIDRSSAKAILGFKKNDFIVCSFGFMAPSKLNHRLLNAWLESPMHRDQNCHLIFVGEKPSDEYGSKIMSILSDAQPDNSITITGWVDMDTFRQYLIAADVGVQLRSLARGETSASALDCLNYGLATIVNANSAMAELPDEAVWKLPDDFSDKQLTEALETLWKDQNRLRLRQMGDNAITIFHHQHSPKLCAERYKYAIEEFYEASFYSAGALVSAIAPNVLTVKDNELARVAENIAESILLNIGLRQLFIDVSVLVRRTNKSGIQRLVNRLLSPLLIHQPEGWRIEPVYASHSHGYRYARRFTLQYLDCNSDNLIDEPIEYKPGDIFLGFDLNLETIPIHQHYFQRIRNDGVNVRMVVYDLLTDSFHSREVNRYTKWLDGVLENVGVVCHS